jgi:hypothetical protein
MARAYKKQEDGQLKIIEMPLDEITASPDTAEIRSLFGWPDDYAMYENDTLLIALEQDEQAFYEASNGTYIPARMGGGITRYIENGIPPGSFLAAVISNNLVGAFGRADAENRDNLYAYVEYFYNHAPCSCWGSKEAYHAWLEKGGNKP